MFGTLVAWITFRPTSAAAATTSLNIPDRRTAFGSGSIRVRFVEHIKSRSKMTLNTVAHCNTTQQRTQQQLPTTFLKTLTKQGVQSSACTLDTQGWSVSRTHNTTNVNDPFRGKGALRVGFIKCTCGKDGAKRAALRQDPRVIQDLMVVIPVLPLQLPTFHTHKSQHIRLET